MISKNKILIIISSWPSRQHPYLTYLFARLKCYFPNIQFFLFENGNDEWGDELIGERCRKAVLNKVLYRFRFTFNPFQYFMPIWSVLLNLPSAVKLFKYCIKNNYEFHQAIGQVIYNHKLLGKKYDLVYINAMQSARHFGLRGLFPETTILVSSRGQDFDFDPEGYDIVLKQIDHLHVLGNYLKEKAVNRGFSASKITIIPPAALPIKMSVHHNRSDNKEFVVVTAARLVWTKGFVYSLRAIKSLIDALPDRCINYHVLGDGPRKDFLQVEAIRLGIHNHVIFHGWQPQDVVNELVSRADAYLLLSIEEGFNNSVIQAQNLGAPCIVSDAGGLPENVENGVTGFVVPRYNANAAAEAMMKLARDPALRRQMGNAASLRARSQFNLESQVVKYAQMFTKVTELHENSLCM